MRQDAVPNPRAETGAVEEEESWTFSHVLVFHWSDGLSARRGAGLRARHSRKNEEGSPAKPGSLTG